MKGQLQHVMINSDN